MKADRRNSASRAETLQRVTTWISQATSPAWQVPAYVAIAEVGQRILKRLALRLLVRRVAEGWIAQPPLLNPSALCELIA